MASSLNRQSQRPSLGFRDISNPRNSKNRIATDRFPVEGENFRGLEQNPNTSSLWAQLARSGKKVMQVLQNGRYIAAVVDGKITIYTIYGRAESGSVKLSRNLPTQEMPTPSVLRCWRGLCTSRRYQRGFDFIRLRRVEIFREGSGGH